MVLPIDQINQKITKIHFIFQAIEASSLKQERKKILQIPSSNLAQIQQSNRLIFQLLHKTSSLSVCELFGGVVWKAKGISCSLSWVAKVSC